MNPNGVLLRRSRMESGYSLSELARELGIDKGQLSKAERGLGGISLKRLKKLSIKLEVPMRELVPELAELQDSA